MRALLGISIIFISAAASAQPAPDSYVSAGTTLGIDGKLDWLYSGVTIDAGTKLSPAWWLHAAVGVVGRTGYGAINQSITLITPSADAYEGRVGPEAHLCTSNGTWCAITGADLGYRTNRLHGLVVAPHVGLDVGGSNFRFRPSVVLEVGGPVDTDEGPPIPDVGLGFTAAVAYQW
jgi:hypothetical protein